MPLAFELRKLRLFGIKRRVQARNLSELGRHALDLLGTRVAEIAVVDEHAAGVRWVLLIEQQLAAAPRCR